MTKRQFDKSYNYFVSRAKAEFGDSIEYLKENYVKMKTPMKMVCKIHGEFTQVPSKHLTGKGCPYCVTDRVANEQRETKEGFIKKSITIHGDKYDYSKVIYQTAKLPVEIICPEHGAFWQTPTKHTSYSCGCSECAHYGINYTLPAILYYLKFEPNQGQIYYKIGITNKTTKERFFQCELEKMEVIFELPYKTAKEAHEIEKLIKRRFKKYQYKGPKLLHRGSTELFIEDILELPNNCDLATIEAKLAALKE